MPDLIKLNIDGNDIAVAPGTLIIEAARLLGIEIPTFCYDQRLKSVGACRMCLVEVEKMPKLIASCATPVAPGMVIHTDSDKVVVARRGVLEFLLINHPLDCPTCDKGGECPLQNLTFNYGPPISRFSENKIRFQDGTRLGFDDLRIGPEIWLNRNRCIICYKCVRIARDLAGGADIGMFNRGAYAKIDIPNEIQYANEFSGNTVEYCPVGALMSDSFRYRVRTWLLERTPSVCWLCPDGCNITVEHRLGRIQRHQSRRNDNIDGGFLCDKGRYGFDITSGTDRIRIPQILNNGSFKEASYEESLAVAIHRLSEEKGASTALLLDTSLTNEDAYCCAEFIRNSLPGSSIAISSTINLRPDYDPLAFGLSVSMPELEQADMVILAGCDLAVEHPIIGLRVKKLINCGVPVYIVNSRQNRLGRFEVVNIRPQYGRESDSLIDFISIKNNQQAAGITPEISARLKADSQKAKNIHILSGALMLANPNAAAYLQTLIKTANELEAKLSILPAESNFIGVSLAGKPNTGFEEIIAKIEAGVIKTLMVAGGNPVNIYPDKKRIMEAFKKVDYLIYWGAYPNSTSDYASLILPQLLPTEAAGSFINIERRIQFLKKPFTTDKAITSLTRLLTDVKIEMGGELYYSAEEVFAAMRKTIPHFGRLEYGKLEGTILPWAGKASFDLPEGSVPAPPKGFPFILNFAASVYYGASGMTIRSNVLSKLAEPQVLLVSPQDAETLELSDGARVQLDTARASGEFVIRITDDVNQGELVLRGFSMQNPPNRFMNGFNNPVYANVTNPKGTRK